MVFFWSVRHFIGLYSFTWLKDAPGDEDIFEHGTIDLNNVTINGYTMARCTYAERNM